MASAKFAFCFPGRDGNVVCQHHNGSWIVFPGSIQTFRYLNEKSSIEEDDSDDVSNA